MQIPWTVLHDQSIHSAPPNAVQSGEVHAYSARGWKGQYLVVVPKARLVALRMRWPEKVDNQWSDIDYWRDFEADVLKLVGLAAGKK